MSEQRARLENRIGALEAQNQKLRADLERATATSQDMLAQREHARVAKAKAEAEKRKAEAVAADLETALNLSIRETRDQADEIERLQRYVHRLRNRTLWQRICNEEA